MSIEDDRSAPSPRAPVTPASAPRAPEGGPAIHRDDVDPQLLRLAQAYLAGGPTGDPTDAPRREACEAVFRACDPVIRSEARRLGLIGEALDEAQQEVRYALVKALPRFRPGPKRGRFLGWVAIFARRKLLDSRRRRARRPSLPLTPAVEAIMLSPEFNPDALDPATEAVLCLAAMLSFLEKTSPDEYRVLTMRLREHRTEQETADALNLRPRRVRDLLHHARTRLRHPEGSAPRRPFDEDL